MLLRWERRRRVRGNYSGVWLTALEELPFVQDLTTAQLRRLVHLAQEFEERVRWEGSGRWRPDAVARAMISLEACRLVLHLGLERYARLRVVRVVPTSWPHATSAGRTMRAGEADQREVKIAWDVALQSVQRPTDGYSIVYHEFAHVLDHHDGHFDGMPVLRDHRDRLGWLRTFGRGLSKLRRILSRREPSVLREYGQSDEVEFFAVCTESFFERPRELRSRHPEIYSALERFYHQDPAGRGRRRSRKARRKARVSMRPSLDARRRTSTSG
jgi:Mlc titration factor MtfA (ptsG expression regulator)